MWTWWRALLAVSLLAGFLVLALAISVGLLALTWWSATGPLAQHGQFTVWLATTAGSVILGLVFAVATAFRRRQPPPAVRLERHQAPELWQLVHSLAGKAGTRPPDHIRLVAEANAGVYEVGTFAGLRRGERFLDVGLPLVTGMTVDQFAAVLAHEFGHYSHNDTRLAEVVYRGYDAIRHLVDVLPRRSPWRILFRGYFLLYWSVSSAVLRRQEWLADQAAAAAVGKAATAGALREVIAIGTAWHHYLDECVALNRSAEWAPDGISHGFGRFLAARATDVSRWRQDLQEVRDRWSTHPPMAERIAALGTAIARANPSPAAGLIADLKDLGAELDRLAFPVGTRTRIPLDEYAVCVTSTERQRDADLLYRAAGTVAATKQVNLVVVLDLLAAGHAAQLAAEVCRNRLVDADPFTSMTLLIAHVHAAMEVAAVRSAAAHWRHSWLTWTELVDTHGNPVELAELADTAVRKPTDSVRARLAALKVDVAAGVLSGTGSHTEVLGAMGPVMANGRPYDLLIFSTCLLLLPGNQLDPGEQTLADRLRGVGTTIPDYGWQVPYTEMVAAQALHPVRAKVLITLSDNTSLRIEEIRRTVTTSVSGNDPRQILRGLTEGLVAAGAPADEVRPIRPAAPTGVLTAKTAADAERARSGRIKMRFGMLALPGLALLIAAGAAGETSTNLWSAGIALTVSGGLVFLWGLVEARARTGQGSVFIVSGLLVLAGFMALEVLARDPNAAFAWSLAVFGALLIGLGVTRRRGHWPKRAGNGWKIAAVWCAAFGLGSLAEQLARGEPPWRAMFLGPAVILFIVGVLLARAVAKSAHRAALGSVAVLGDTSTTWGLLGAVYSVLVPPVGLAFGIASIRAARKIGKRPVLGVVVTVTSSVVSLAITIAILIQVV